MKTTMPRSGLFLIAVASLMVLMSCLASAFAGEDRQSDADGVTRPVLSELQLRQILQDIFKQDQSDTDRSAAPACYKKLLSLRQTFADTRCEANYNYSLSFETLHLAQQECLQHHSVKAAIKYLKKSVQYAEENERLLRARDGKVGEIDSGWTNYIKATFAYLTGDRTTLEALQGKCDGNDKTIARLVDGLKKFGTPDYQRDY